MSTDRCTNVNGANVHGDGTWDDTDSKFFAEVVAAAQRKVRSDAEKKRISDAEDRINPCRS